jgi:hypothetical protein
MLQTAFYAGRLCESNLSYEFFPHHPLHLPLLALAREMEKGGRSFDIKTEFVLVFRIKGIKVSLYPSGKILVKNMNVESEAHSIFSAVLSSLNRCPSLRLC